jgi:zeaxanthin glucosyltransferase
VAVFSMTETGHFQRLRPLVAGLAGRGCDVHVLADSRFAREAEEDGASFGDLFERHSLAEADDRSMPFPCRFVSFAGLFADEVAERVRKLAPDLIVSDTFAVVGRVVARILGVPHINVCAGHNMQPAETVAALREDQRVELAPQCERAVDLLRRRHGMEDASPFSYVDGASPHLNLYCEPPRFLRPEERAPFEPIAFHGSLPAAEAIQARLDAAAPEFPADARLRVYASFGTVVWRYWRNRALEDLAAVARAVAARPGAAALISLGGTELSDAERARLDLPGVRVAGLVDQWAALAEADAMVTHQGLNSTHEAVWCGVPMLARPFFSDQPALAERCRELGLSAMLATGPDADLDPATVTEALDRIEDEGESLAERMAAAGEWEAETIAGRPPIWDRVIGLADTPAAS